MFKCMWLFALLYICAAAQAQERLDQLTVLTEDLPPQNFLKDGVATGCSVDLLLQTAQLMDSPIKSSQIQVRRWEESLQYAQSNARVLLFGMAKTQGRLALFKWAGPAGQGAAHFIGLRERYVDPNSTEPLKIGMLRGDINEVILREQAKFNWVLVIAPQAEDLLTLLNRGEIDLLASTASSVAITANNMGLKPSRYKVVSLLHKFDLYFAFSLDVDDRLIEKFQSALTTLNQKALERGEILCDYRAEDFIP